MLLIIRIVTILVLVTATVLALEVRSIYALMIRLLDVTAGDCVSPGGLRDLLSPGLRTFGMSGNENGDSRLDRLHGLGCPRHSRRIHGNHGIGSLPVFADQRSRLRVAAGTLAFLISYAKDLACPPPGENTEQHPDPVPGEGEGISLFRGVPFFHGRLLP